MEIDRGFNIRCEHCNGRGYHRMKQDAGTSVLLGNKELKYVDLGEKSLWELAIVWT